MNSKKSISRREFISRAAAGTAAMALTPLTSVLANPQAAGWAKDATKFTFYMVGHGHIDPVWLWPWTEGVSVVHSTFRSVLDRMRETPDMVFMASSAQFYEWVSENDPAMLAEIRQRIEAGNWNVVGGWWVEPDMNIPSGEAMVRQGLYGQRTLQKLLGRRAKVATNPDSFGHPSTLPQIITKQGMPDYLFMRPQSHEKTIPSDLFWWEAPDGTKVLTYRIQDSYNESNDLHNRMESIMRQCKGQPMTEYMAFFGAGDHGGGPTKRNLQSIAELQKEKGAPTVKFGTLDQYFANARAKNMNLPTVKDDLQHHAVGCYSAESEIKKNNRLSEAALVAAEKICAIGSSIWGAAYPKDDFTKAWKQVLFLQFHDSLAGSSLMAHSQDAREGHNYALNIAHTAAAIAAQKLEWNIASEDPDSEYLVAFNPHAWEVKANIDYDISNKPQPIVTDASGKELLAQYVQSHSITGRRRILFGATLPPMGYQQFRIRKGETTPASKVSASGNTLENEYLRVTISANGEIGIYDKENSREVFKGGATGCKGVIIDDPSDTWSHEVVDFTKNTTGDYNYQTKGEIGSFGNAQLTVIENGPLRAAINVITKYGDSNMSTVWMLTAGSRRLEADVTLNWNERLKMLKFSFPVNVETPEATYETPYGNIVRKNIGEEDPGQRWIDVTGENKGYGVTVFNDAKYGYSVNGSDMRITVTRSAPYAHHGPTPMSKLDPDGYCYWMDQGIQTMRLMVVPHTHCWRSINAPRVAEEFIARPIVAYQGIHGGSMAKSGSFMEVDAKNIVLSALKISEDGNYGIIRLVETIGKEADFKLRFPSVDYSWSGKIKPYEIKTLRLDTQYGDIREVNLLEE